MSVEREKNGPYRLRGLEGDVAVNPTLAHLLQHDFNLKLPSFDPFDGFGEEADLDGYFDALSELVRGNGWSVDDDAWLSHFSFEKLVMYEDLSLPVTAQAIAAHPVLAAICGIRDYDGPEVSFEEAGTAFELPDAYPVVDADSSQLKVLMQARAGSSLVVQGPPGTGKSQTIVNLIAQGIRDGKSVLFVSEKRAALDVVHRRLRDAGLSDLCLELHSHKANKREVVQDLYFAMESSRGSIDAADTERFAQRVALRQRLDAYVAALHRPRGAGRKTAYQMHGALALLEEVPAITAALPIESYVDLETEREARLVEAIHELTVSGVWDSARTHPWQGASFEDPAFVARQELIPMAQRLQNSLRIISSAEHAYEGLVGEPSGVLSIESLPTLLELLDALASMPRMIEASWLSEDAAVFAGATSLVEEGAGAARRARAARTKLQARQAQTLCDNSELVASLLPRFSDSYSCGEHPPVVH